MKKINVGECKLGDILYSDAVDIHEELIAPAGTIVDSCVLGVVQMCCTDIVICTTQLEVDQVVSDIDIYLPTLEMSALNYANYTVKKLLQKKIIKHFYNNADMHMHRELKHHQINVAILVAIYLYLDGSLNLSKNKDIILGALLHDVGKLRLPDSIIHSGRKFTVDERVIMQSHTSLGYEMLKSQDMPDLICCIARDHHECGDGSGYPHKKLEPDLSYAAQLVHIVDVYEALCAERNYKKIRERHQSRELMLGELSKYNRDLLHRFFEVVPEYFPGDLIIYKDSFYRVIGYEKDKTPILRKAMGNKENILMTDLDNKEIKSAWFNLSKLHTE